MRLACATAPKGAAPSCLSAIEGSREPTLVHPAPCLPACLPAIQTPALEQMPSLPVRNKAVAEGPSGDEVLPIRNKPAGKGAKVVPKGDALSAVPP